MQWRGHARTLAGLMVPEFALGLTANPATPPASGTPDPRDRINLWAGHWKEKELVQTKLTPYRHAASAPSHETCAWTADRGSVVCQYLSEKVGAREGKPSDHVTIFACNDAGKNYKHRGISKDYKTLEEVAAINGNAWHYNCQLREDTRGEARLPGSVRIRHAGEADHADRDLL
jgi:hypothetical protein